MGCANTNRIGKNGLEVVFLLIVSLVYWNDPNLLHSEVGRTTMSTDPNAGKSLVIWVDKDTYLCILLTEVFP